MFENITTGVVVASLALAASTASAESWFQFEAGIGASVYSKGPDGLWLQDAFPHKLRLEAPAFETGLTGPVWQSANWGVDWHADWAWLGSVHTDALAVPLDSNYNSKTKSCNGTCLPLADYSGSGHAQVAFIALEPHYDIGKWRLGVEAGPSLYRTTWVENVNNIQYSAGAPPISMRLASTDGWRVGAVVGASVSRGPFSLVYQHFFMKSSTSNPAPPIWHSVDSLFIKYRF
ncbi:hypothetical protein SAMN05216466_10759 [Paraburkholderia phenazinium]|uniref:Uncharacterized protein n=1 Tax=Paraburkholderia phenazinium TaxID=60549 RepID=A0A1G7ZLE7_9BURK|nr:hypothetical protein [Paraburkholderia phenazinium]SDH08920.1 hypothetical protein SAMN05216466_10759 [Paraburkholderia phenazinium]